MKRNLDRYILIAVIVIFIVLIFFYVKDTLKTNKTNEIEVTVSETIENYNYKLKSNKSSLYKNKFNELKVLLESNNFDEEDYLKLISELFIIDFYTLHGKISNTDIGGTDFIHSSIKDNFELKATDTMYKYIENNLYGNNNQELPIVKEVTIENIKTVTYNYNNNTDENAYEVSLSWTYEKDLEYETEKTLYFVHEDKKLALVEIK